MYTPKVMPPPRITHAIEWARGKTRRLIQRVVPAPLGVLELASGWMMTQALCAAAALGIADVLVDGPRSADRIAAEVGADPDATYRLLRALAGHGVFIELPDRCFALNSMADTLRADSPRTVRPVLLMVGHPIVWAARGQLVESVATGRSGHELAHGIQAFDQMAANPELASGFNDAMRVTTQMAERAILSAYDFSRFARIVDVGGGSGYLLAAILRSAPRAKGIVYDLTAATAEAGKIFTGAGVTERAAIENGSFFDATPAGADAYVLKHIIHDWPDEQALQILHSVRRAIAPRGRLLLIECVVPRRNSAHLSVWLDIEVMLAIGGRERTGAEYTELLARAGFLVRRIVPTIGPHSIIEAVPNRSGLPLT
ncbi:methyltransferase [Nocardia sp. GCM10030253]|uniref:methyltransferase n=1 Tax=Nocardia sp. GCM10030253 TaxID=3273404 RepID=UPI003625C19C